MEYSLILDTSNRLLCVGVANEEKVLSKIQYEAWQRQSEFCLKEVEKVLKENNLSARQISRIVVTIGPGSYTGVRIALTIAKTLAMVNDCPICAISSLQAIAGSNGNKISLMDARSKRAYIGIYKDGKEVEKNKVLPLVEIAEIIKNNPDFEVVGDSSLLGIESNEVDMIDNMFNLSKTLPNVTNTYTLVPNYLKD